MMYDFTAECGHKFCYGCIKEHMKYCIKNSQIIQCLESGCEHFLDEFSNHVLSLAPHIRERYYFIRIEKVMAFNQHMKICPTLNCQEGFLVREDKTDASLCYLCNQTYCFLCLKTANNRFVK